jgi:hypothetical protein
LNRPRIADLFTWKKALTVETESFPAEATTENYGAVERMIKKVVVNSRNNNATTRQRPQTFDVKISDAVK